MTIGPGPVRPRLIIHSVLQVTGLTLAALSRHARTISLTIFSSLPQGSQHRTPVAGQAPARHGAGLPGLYLDRRPARRRLGPDETRLGGATGTRRSASHPTWPSPRTRLRGPQAWAERSAARVLGAWELGTGQTSGSPTQPTLAA